MAHRSNEGAFVLEFSIQMYIVITIFKFMNSNVGCVVIYRNTSLKGTSDIVFIIKSSNIIGLKTCVLRKKKFNLFIIDTIFNLSKYCPHLGRLNLN